VKGTIASGCAMVTDYVNGSSDVPVKTVNDYRNQWHFTMTQHWLRLHLGSNDVVGSAKCAKAITNVRLWIKAKEKLKCRLLSTVLVQ